MRGHTKFLGGFEKIEGARRSWGLLQRGVLYLLLSHHTIQRNVQILQKSRVNELYYKVVCSMYLFAIYVSDLHGKSKTKLSSH